MPCLRLERRIGEKGKDSGFPNASICHLDQLAVFIFHCCMINPPSFSSFLKCQFIISLFCKTEIKISSSGFSAQGLLRLKPRCQPAWALIQKLWGKICFQAHSCCWQNLVSCDCGTEVQVAGCWSRVTLSSWRSFSDSCPTFSISLMENLSCLNSSHVLNLSAFLFCQQKEKTLFLKNSHDQVMPTWIISFSVNSESTDMYPQLQLQNPFCHVQ